MDNMDNMEEIEEQAPKQPLARMLGTVMGRPMLLAGIAFVVGLLIGWLVIGWGVWPLEWTDAAPSDLRESARVDYLRMAIDSYNLEQNQSAADRRLAELGETAGQALAAVEAAPENQSREVIAIFQQMLGVTPAAPGEAVLPGVETTTDPVPEPAAGGLNIQLILIMCGVTALLLVAVAGVFYWRNRGASGPPTTMMQAHEMSLQAEQTDYSAMGESPPIAQWMTTYLLGDDLFDDSFSIDAAAGEFMGECGVGIADTIGVGDPKRVSAFEVWIFDKNDIQTVTKVLMSAHAFQDDATRERLEAKGEPVMGQPGIEMVLETETLRMVARVVDMGFGEGALPDNSFFDRLTIELAVWSKQM